MHLIPIQLFAMLSVLSLKLSCKELKILVHAITLSLLQTKDAPHGHTSVVKRKKGESDGRLYAGEMIRHRDVRKLPISFFSNFCHSTLRHFMCESASLVCSFSEQTLGTLIDLYQ